MFSFRKSGAKKGGNDGDDTHDSDSAAATAAAAEDDNPPPPLPNLEQLERLAVEWKARVTTRNLIQDRTYHFQTYQECFLGTEAVTVLYELLREQQESDVEDDTRSTASTASSSGGGTSVSRWTAVAVGRYMARAFDWFEHVAQGHELKDEPLFYRFNAQSQLPSQLMGGIQLDAQQLEHIAQQFKEWMVQRNLIQDRTYHLKTYPQCFLGTEAVTLLVELLQEQIEETTTTVSRQRAVYVGRQLAQTFTWFEHVTRDHYLKDLPLFYRFVPLVNLPSQVHLPEGTTKQLRALEANIPIADRQYRLRTYPQCFVGSEAVDTVLRMKWACTRRTALQWLRHLNRDAGHVMEHVTRDHKLKDGYYFYRFLKRQDRMLTLRSSDMQTIDAMIMAELTALETMQEQEQDGGHVHEMLVPTDGGVSTGTTITCQTQQQQCQPLAEQEYTPEQLQDIAHVLERELPVGSHGYRLATYQNCFVVRDAVTFLVQRGHAKTRADAERLGQRLERRLDLWHHVVREHVFRDKFYFFRFTPEPERQPTTINDDAGDRNDPEYLESIGRALHRGLTMESECYFRTKRCKNFARGSAVVDFLIHNKYAATRVEATELGERLANDVQWLVPATVEFNDEANDEQQYNMVEFMPFVDCRLSLYKFVPEPIRQQRMAMLQDQQKQQQERLQRTMLLGRRSTSSTGDASSTDGIDDEQNLLMAAAERFQEGVRVQNHRYHGRTYRSTFVGSDAVSFMVNSEMSPNRRSAVQLGRKFQTQLKLFDHVKGVHLFKDDYLFFKFTTKESKVAGPEPSLADFSSLVDDSTDFRPLETIALEFRKRVNVSDRQYRLTTYKNVFLGKDAVDYLLGTKWAASRQEAVQLGQCLERDLGLFHHVTHGHKFEDAAYFYTFRDECVVSLTERLEKEKDPFASQFTLAQLAKAAQTLELGLTPKDHRYHFTLYRDTLVASDVVDFMVENNLASSRKEAVGLGRALAREFNLWEHVTLDHLFKDAALFFRFVPRRNRLKGVWFTSYGKDKHNAHALRKLSQGKNITTERYWESILHMVEIGKCEIGLFASETLPVKEWEVTTIDNDNDWASRVKQFEIRISQRRSGLRLSTQQFLAQEIMSPKFSPHQRWLSSLWNLDPRKSIHIYFNEIAQTGAPHKLKDNCILSLVETRPLIRFLPFNLASVFSVWRPTSFDAIRKMMTGEAVGKGLNIKGKSAKRGKLSGFVPFLQISNNQDKFKVRRLSPEQTVRVFYHTKSRRSRDNAAARLQEIAQDMLQTVKEAKRILAKDSSDSQMYEDALQSMLLDMPDPSIVFIDDYAPECFGLEMPERLFWEAYCMRQDCTRKPGSVYDTGRPSQPAFQDMNFAALRACNQKQGGPRTVIFQNADRDDDPLHPQELLMAYEEHGRVRPVVSDFDCFLVGTRRVQFNAPLPASQLDVLKWCVNQIEKILQDTLRRDDNDKLAWTILWLEVLKEASKEGYYPETPKFGFGDPKSYSIMENAVDRLMDSGAVRHGAECFNYIFPQDLDTEYLVIAEGVGGPNVPFKYVGVDELQSILSQKIDEGFTFPLNPKWILWDGWKHLYDKLLASTNKDVQESMKVWFPPDSGLRERIESIQHLQYSLRRKYRKVKSVRELITEVGC